MTSKRDLCDRDFWPNDRVGQALRLLGEHAGLARAKRETDAYHEVVPSPGDDIFYELAFSRYLDFVADRIGFSCVQLTCNAWEVETLIRSSAPLLLTQLRHSGTLALLRIRGNTAQIITTDGDLRRVAVQAIVAEVTVEARYRADRGTIDRLFLALNDRKLAQLAGQVIMAEQMRKITIREAWQVRDHSQASWQARARQNRLFSRLFYCFAAYGGHLCAAGIAWYLIGRAALSGEMESGWLLAWGLALICMVPLRLLASHFEWDLHLRLRTWLREAIIENVLGLRRDAIIERGSNAWHAALRELHGVDAYALTMILRASLAFFDLCSATLLAYYAGVGPLYTICIVCIGVVGAVLGWHGIVANEAGLDSRFAMTAHNIDVIRGHATRVMQQAPKDWHRAEDRLIRDHAKTTLNLQHSRTWLAALPRFWLSIGLIPLAYLATIAAPNGSAVLLAAAAYFLTNSAIATLLADAAAAQELFVLIRRALQRFKGTRAIKIPDRTINSTPNVPGVLPTKAGQTLLEARELRFAFPGRPQILAGVSLTIAVGDRILLTGPSGGGKSTLVSLLAGLRQPNAGIVLARGIDRQTLGDDRWRRHIVAAPQFHENHIFCDTLLFNLTLGCMYPPSPDLINDALAICHELGLGPLLERMPSGLAQVVGEPGWTLSHGERSRIWLARALIQRPDVLILDESFGALDPETLQVAMKCVRERARALVVVAHP